MNTPPISNSATKANTPSITYSATAPDAASVANSAAEADSPGVSRSAAKATIHDSLVIAINQLTSSIWRESEIQGISWGQSRYQRLMVDLRDAVYQSGDTNLIEEVSSEEYRLWAGCIAAQFSHKLVQHKTELSRDEPACSAIQLQFRHWEEQDAARYARLLNDESLWRYMPEPMPDTISQTSAELLIALCNSRPDHHLVQAVLFDAEPVGQVRIEFLNDPRIAEVSYWLSQFHRNRGIGKTMLKQYVQEIWANVPSLKKLMAKVHPDNCGSLAVLGDAGFYHERIEQAETDDIQRYVLSLYRPF